jgi:GNAT superfamily N-acetyltransferase
VIPAPESNPDALCELFAKDRAIHSYGLADLEEPFWSSSVWFRSEDAAVGILELPGADIAIVYAVSNAAPEACTELVVDLAKAGKLPDRFLLTAPVGIEGRIAATFTSLWCEPQKRMQLVDSSRLGPVPSGLAGIGRADLAVVERLFASAPDSGRFFTPWMLETGAYVGRFEGEELIALAGVHVLSERYRVAAIGNVLTHPDHRGRGHASEMLAGLCRRLSMSVDVITLNVSDDNDAARRLYDRLGFAPVIAFDEGEFVRRRP